MPESHDDDVYDLLRLPEAAPPVDVYDSLDIDAVTFGADGSRRSLRRFGADEDFDRTRVISGVITSPATSAAPEAPAEGSLRRASIVMAAGTMVS
ncbi:hypothetical protein QUG18_25495, partial [Escherichia coli]|uniref:hypothetical protein n=1 Tax=Escherichia coli TaxID=562 RepID=UPI0025A073EF